MGGNDPDRELRDVAEQDDVRGGVAGAGPAAGEDHLRIDELARLSGTTVDTVRFYQREGLLPPATRRGRSLLYGPAHLERLERIRDLQARHFTLKGIRTLAEEGRLAMLDRLFGGQKRTFTRDELIAESGLAPDEVEQLESAGLLRDPALHGALAYDGEDLAVLTTLRASMERGMPASVAVLIVRTFDRLVEEMRNDLFEIFNVDGSGLAPVLSDGDLDAFRTVAANGIDNFLDDSCVVLEYLHRRGVRRLVVEAMARADPPGAESD